MGVAPLFLYRKTQVEPRHDLDQGKILRLLIDLLSLVKMTAVIKTSATCKVRAVIRFVTAINYSEVAIHLEIFSVHGLKVMSNKAVRNCFCSLKSGRTNTHDDKKSV